MQNGKDDQSVLVLGGYGTFGRRIVMALIRDGISVIVGGRSLEKAGAFVDTLPKGLAIAGRVDVRVGMSNALSYFKPAVVINTVGPFQGADYSVAKACIQAGVAYIDLADGRDFVRDFGMLDELAKEKGVLAVSGASTVPGLSSAVIDHFSAEFKQIHTIRYGINPGQKTERGLATTQGVLSYVGRRLNFKTRGKTKPTYGWQNVHRRKIPTAGYRWFANCDIPDLDLFPSHYGIENLRFGAGLELGFMHLGLWLMGWLIRLGLPIDLKKFAKPLLHASNYFNGFGSDVGAMYMELEGTDATGTPSSRTWHIVANSGDGPQIPTVPAIFLTKQILNGKLTRTGAMACVGLIPLDAYLGELREFDVRTYTDYFKSML